MTAANPRSVADSLHVLANEGQKLLREYSWAHGVAYGQERRGERAEGSIATGDPNDPTGNTVAAVDKQRMRRALQEASERIDQAHKELRSASYSLAHSIRELEPAEVVLAPSLVTRAEMASSRAAQDRRQLRGEDFGEA